MAGKRDSGAIRGEISNSVWGWHTVAVRLDVEPMNLKRTGKTSSSAPTRRGWWVPLGLGLFRPATTRKHADRLHTGDAAECFVPTSPAPVHGPGQIPASEFA